VKKLQLDSERISTSFKTDDVRERCHGSETTSLETDKRKGITKTIAETLCTNLFGVWGCCNGSTPEAYRDVADGSAVRALHSTPAGV
jgi:hypothetical protein